MAKNVTPRRPTAAVPASYHLNDAAEQIRRAAAMVLVLGEYIAPNGERRDADDVDIAAVCTTLRTLEAVLAEARNHVEEQVIKEYLRPGERTREAS